MMGVRRALRLGGAVAAEVQAPVLAQTPAAPVVGLSNFFWKNRVQITSRGVILRPPLRSPQIPTKLWVSR